MSIRPKLLRYLVFPLGDLIRGRSLVGAMEALETTQWWPRTRLLDLQAERLSAVISHAYEGVPYYREAMRARMLSPADIRSPADLAKLPLLTREEVRSNYPERLCARKLPPRDQRQGRTGGSSTGEPLFFTYDRQTMDYARAVLYRAFTWAGCPPGTPSLTLWGQPVAKGKKSARLNRKLQEFCLGVYWVDAFRLDDAVMRESAAILEEGRVEFIYAYVSSLHELCRYLREHGRQPRGLRAAMTTAEVLLPETRRFIEQTLQTGIFDGYGCAEVNGVAYECAQHNGLHVGMERAIVEIVDSAGIAVSPGQPGRIAITDLHNFAMPLIRYVNGDEAQLSIDRCSCGRHSDRLQEILGRTCDIVDGVNGRHVHSYYFASLFGALGWAQTHGLRQFQIVQETQQRLCVRLAIRDRPSGSEEQRLLGMLTEFLGPMTFQIEYLERLESSRSGKFRWTMNLARSNGQPIQ